MFISNAYAQAAPAASADPFGAFGSMLLPILMIAVLYFVMIRPQMKRQKEHRAMVDALAKGVHFIGKKVVEEAAESWMAAEHEGPERAAEEISQLLYQAQVLMLATGLELKDVYRHL